MRIWPRALRFLWEEEPASAPPGPVADAPRETTGVPQFLQRATRWSVTATVGATLMAQVVGVRLIAPVDAHGSYIPNNGCAKDLVSCLLKHHGDVHGTLKCLKDFEECLKESRHSLLGAD